MAEQSKKIKKQKPKGTTPKGLEPRRPFTSKKIFRVIVFSIVGSLSVILITQQIGQSSESGSISEIGLMETALFNMAIIEAVFGGLAAGKIGSGSYVAGVKDVVAMIVIAVIAFNIV